MGGVGLVLYNHNNFRKNMVLYHRYVENDLTKEDIIPDHARAYPGLRKGLDPRVISYPSD